MGKPLRMAKRSFGIGPMVWIRFFQTNSNMYIQLLVIGEEFINKTLMIQTQ